MKIGNKEFDVNSTDYKCYVMGILNVTPDSFSDGGKWNTLDKAKEHVARMIEEGADIIDMGGESTRPGHEQISINEEIERVAPVIEMIKSDFDIPVSIDSYKADVIAEALKSGADLINDIWGFRYEKFYENCGGVPRIAQLAAQYDVPVCLMHNRPDMDYTNYIEDVLSDLQDSVDIALKAGVKKDNIILDPGIGFAKDLEKNLILTNRLEELNKLGYPVLLATSRKSMIGLSLDLPSDERLEGTIATTVMGVMKGAAFVRVHDVKENKRAIEMTRAILNEQKCI